jgi:ribosomal protein S18 acetylase RimI-like enzyme
LHNPGRVINLKDDGSFIAQYVELRNKYCELLLTESVDVEETKKWIKNENVEIVGVVKGDALVGVAILYIYRAGEIAFFVRTPNHGTGSYLLKIVERIARDRGIMNIWAWVLDENIAAQRTFVKAGYAIEEISSKYFKRILRKGVVFRKTINWDGE